MIKSEVAAVNANNLLFRKALLSCFQLPPSDEVREDVPFGLVLDVALPGLSGLDLQKRMPEANREIPIVFITGHKDVPTSVRAMKAGAVEFLVKPFSEKDLLDAIQQAIKRDQSARYQQAQMEDLCGRYESRDYLQPRHSPSCSGVNHCVLKT